MIQECVSEPRAQPSKADAKKKKPKTKNKKNKNKKQKKQKNKKKNQKQQKKTKPKNSQHGCLKQTTAEASTLQATAQPCRTPVPLHNHLIILPFEKK